MSPVILQLIPVILTAAWGGLFLYNNVMAWPAGLLLLWAIVLSGTLLNIFARPDNSATIRWMVRALFVCALIMAAVLIWWILWYWEVRGLYSYRGFQFLGALHQIMDQLIPVVKWLLLSVPIASFLALYVLFEDLCGAGTRSHLSGQRKRANSDLYGDSKFMERKKLIEMSKRPGGIILGQMEGMDHAKEKKLAAKGKLVSKRNRIISYPLEGSTFTLAIPRSGKTSIIMANLLADMPAGHERSRVIFDPRGETFAVCANNLINDHRNLVLLDPYGVIEKHGHPMGEFVDCYNPLDFIREGQHFQEDVNRLTEAIVKPPNTKSDAAEHFYEASVIIISGLIAWVCATETGPKRTLNRVYELFMLSQKDFKKLLHEMGRNPERADGMPHAAATRYQRIEDKEKGSTFSSAQGHLKFLAQTRLSRQLARSTFDPMALTEGKTDLFIVVPEDAIKAATNWIRLWIAMCYSTALRKKPRNNMLFIIDEMPRLGYMEPIMECYQTAAGTGVSFMCFAQEMAALEQAYGPQNALTLMKSAELVQVLELSRTDVKWADQFSQALGSVTYESPNMSQSQSVQSSGLWAERGSEQEQAGTGLVRGWLVTPDDLMMADSKHQYILIASKEFGKEPVKCGKLRYWLRPEFGYKASPNPVHERTGNTNNNKADF